MSAIAISRLDEHRVGLRWGLGRWHQTVVWSAQVARKKDASARNFQQQTGGAQYMPSTAEFGIPTRNGLEPCIEFFYMKLLHAVFGVLFCVQGQGGVVFGIAVFVGKVGVFLLNVPTVWQQDAAQIARA